MLSLLNIKTVARFEIKTLLRSWFFRIFSILTLIILGFFDLMIITDVGPNPPWLFRAIPSSIPYFNLLIFNLVQAVIIVFLASDFLKRDKKLDTTDVIYIRSMSNGDYVIGKTIGVFVVFFMLNMAVLLLALIFNFVQTDTPVVWEAYFYYPLIISLPTLLYITGLSFLMMVVLRNQAVTFIILLGYIASTLFFLTARYNYVFDYMAFKLPLMYSDFTGFGNLDEIRIQRGIYLFTGIGFIFLTILLIKRLPQSKGMTGFSYLAAMVFVFFSAYLSWIHISKHNSIARTKAKMIEMNNAFRNESPVNIDAYSIDLAHEGEEINVRATMRFSNKSSDIMDKLLFSLNPALEVSEITLAENSINFQRNHHLVLITPGAPIHPGTTGEITIKYRGTVNDQLCYLDIEPESLGKNYNLAFMNIDKRYGFIEENFVHLTPEVLWYPIAGATYSPENPTFHNKQFSKYNINVTSKKGLKVISQGEKVKNADGSVTFSESVPLPQVSLTIGEFVEKSIEIDHVKFSLYHLDGHDFFAPYISDLSDTLSSVIKEIKTDYELDLNLDYYYKNLSLVEVPIQIHSYPRRWSSYQEVVQPQMLFVPEKCAPIAIADLKGTYDREKDRIERSNRAVSDRELQARVLNRFLRATFTNGFAGGRIRNFNQQNPQEIARAITQSSKYEIFPNYYSFIYHVKSGEWSILNQAFESYIAGENEDMMSLIRRRIGGLSGEENANQALLKSSFEEILKTETDRELMDEVIKAKGNYLFAFIQNRVGIDNFRTFLSKILSAHKFKSLDIEVFNKELKKEFGFDLEPHLEDWLKAGKIPGFLLSNMNAYEIRDGENTRYQVLFTITNEEEIGGLATVSFRIMSSFGGFGGFGGGGMPSLDLERIIYLEPNQRKEVGIVLDGEPRLMVINTLISKNIPSAISHFFNKIERNEKLAPFDGERILEITQPRDKEFEIIVDNEDEGFELVEQKNESPLKRWLDIQNDADQQKYTGIRFNRPPSSWKATAQPEFYGKYVLSAYVTSRGDGGRKAIWNANIRETGMHEIYYYVGRMPVRGRGRPGGGAGRGRPGGADGNNRQQNQGSYLFTIHHDDGIDDVEIDLANAEEGWNLMGNFYLSSGPAKVVLSNKTEGNLVIADAVKWVKID
ncbi:MAG: hypothetical protein MI975_19260 [Cytophagales bacterium]|nr:hypothetical protein [Cytophagales bacterium]